jgi:hypothetical protein
MIMKLWLLYKLEHARVMYDLYNYQKCHHTE